METKPHEENDAPLGTGTLKEHAVSSRYMYDLILGDNFGDPAAATVAFVIRNRAALVPFTEALQAALEGVLDKALDAGDTTPDAAANLRASWMPTATPEALASWLLDRGGWARMDAPKLEAELLKAWPDTWKGAAETKDYKRGLDHVLAIESVVDVQHTVIDMQHLPTGGASFMPTKIKLRAALWKPPPQRPPLSVNESTLSRAVEAADRAAGITAKRAGENPTLEQEERYQEAWRDLMAATAEAGNDAPYVWPLPGDNTPPEPVYLRSLEGVRTALKLGLWEVLAVGATGPDWKPLDPPTPWLRLLVGPWIQEAAERETERIQRDALAVGFAIREKAETQAGNKWTPLPRALEAAAALGGPVEMNGETYAPEPEMAGAAVGRALRPRALDVVPADWLGKPSQMTLALDPDAPPAAVREYMIETATRTATLAQLPNMVPKLLGFMFAAAPMTARPVKGTLLELARWLYPDWTTRRQNKRDLQGLGAAFVAVKGLRLVESKPDGVRHPYDLFTVDYDLSCKPDAALGFMLNPWLVDRMKGGKQGGFFLLNMTRWLALGIQNPRLFPLALRLAATWDKARKGGIFDPTRLRPIESDRLAYETNTLPPGAAMYRTGKTSTATDKAALAKARANMEADLDALREAGLLGDWKKQKVHGKGFTVLPVPPEDYAEACRLAARNTRKRKP